MVVLRARSVGASPQEASRQSRSRMGNPLFIFTDRVHRTKVLPKMAHDQAPGNETRANVSEKHTWGHHLGQRADDLGAVWKIRHFEVQRRQALVLLHGPTFYAIMLLK